MKKMIYVFAFSLAAAPLLAAASTCETRVDKHGNSTTAERVKQCLTEPTAEPDNGPVTEVVISDTYSVQFPKKKNKKSKAKAKPVEQKVYSKQASNMEFFDREDYPAFRNDTLPNVSQEEAHDAAMEALRHSKKADKPAKKKKPARKVKAAKKPAAVQAPAPQEYAPVTEYAPAVEQPAATAAPASYTAPTQTPPAKVAQAQALQNDPLYQSYTDNGVAPEGFTEGSVMGPDNFSYNATDPAYQP